MLTGLWHAEEVLLAGERVKQRVQASGNIPAPSELRQIEVLVPGTLRRHLCVTACDRCKSIWFGTL